MLTSTGRPVHLAPGLPRGLRVNDNECRIAPAARVAFIGLVAFKTHRGDRAEAVLDFNGLWHCKELPVLDRVLNALHDPAHKRDGDAPFGHSQLIRVAEWLGGDVEWL